MERMMSLFSLDDKVCVVTGSTKGIGLRTVQRMAEAGARVVVTSRDVAAAQRVGDAIDATYGTGRALAVGFDLADPDSPARLIDTVLARWGRIDTLMASAAHIEFGRLLEIDDRPMADSLANNITRHADLARRVVPVMREQGGGSIIFVLSTLGFFASPSYLPYSVAKAALRHLIPILAVDFGRDNIRVNGIAPGITATEGSSFIHSHPGRLQVAVGKTPLGRVGDPDEIAGCAIFLASAAGGYVTGQTIIADGGQTLRGMEGAEDVLSIMDPADTGYR
jgi:NAD(P)-dependent dehydrogenase (short-subunit alcohol dehydrogenase family)